MSLVGRFCPDCPGWMDNHYDYCPRLRKEGNDASRAGKGMGGGPSIPGQDTSLATPPAVVSDSFEELESDIRAHTWSDQLSYRWADRLRALVEKERDVTHREIDAALSRARVAEAALAAKTEELEHDHRMYLEIQESNATLKADNDRLGRAMLGLAQDIWEHAEPPIPDCETTVMYREYCLVWAARLREEAGK